MNKQVDKWVEDEIKKIKQTIHPYNGKIYQAENLITGEMRILRRSLDDIVRHNEDYQVKIYAVSDFSEKLKEWKAIGWKPVDAGKHEEAEYFLYYELEVMGKIVFANVKMHKAFKGEVLYTIQETRPINLRGLSSRPK